MNDEDRTNILCAIFDLMAHNLWRRGKMNTEPCSPDALGEAIETVCGAALDYLNAEAEFSVTARALKNAEAALARIKQDRDELEAENRRLEETKSEAEPKKLTQAVFNDLPKEYRWAAVGRDGIAYVYKKRPFVHDPKLGFWFWGVGDFDIKCVEGFFDASDWQRSLIERED